jgi:hypothetical protein
MRPREEKVLHGPRGLWPVCCESVNNEVPHSNKPGITQAYYTELSVNAGPSHPYDDPGAQTMPHH